MNVKHFIEDKILLFEITEELDHHQTEKIRNRADYEIQRFIIILNVQDSFNFNIKEIVNKYDSRPFQSPLFDDGEARRSPLQPCVHLLLLP